MNGWVGGWVNRYSMYVYTKRKEKERYQDEIRGITERADDKTPKMVNEICQKEIFDARREKSRVDE